jgi:hypothetical protein
MKRNLNLTLAFAAGLLGGVTSRWFAPTPVLAQAPAAVPKEIKAQRFTLVGEDGAVLGTFGAEPRLNGRIKATGSIRLFDESGKEIWSAGGPQIRTLGER